MPRQINITFAEVPAEPLRPYLLLILVGLVSLGKLNLIKQGDLVTMTPSESGNTTAAEVVVRNVVAGARVNTHLTNSCEWRRERWRANRQR